MTSFTLQETVNYFTERGTNVYCCLLDVSSAFDTVWIDGLFSKLFNIGINGKIWRLLYNAYLNMKSCVLYDGLLSDWFHLKQSVRQGGVLSAWLYILFINDLICELEQFGLGCYIGDILWSATKRDMDQMLNICYNYSKKWRYMINPSKSNVIIFGESNNIQKMLCNERSWILGNSAIIENTDGKHVGIMLKNDMRSTDRTLNANKKLRASFMSIIGVGSHPDQLNPITSKKIYSSICLPRALFGCELWGILSKTEYQILEKTHRFCIKYLQGLPRRTRTDVCTAMLGITDLTSFIHIRQLLFLRRLCNLPRHSRVKGLFLFMLVSGYSRQRNAHKSITDSLLSLLRKYDLYKYLDIFIESGLFPSTHEWKRIVKTQVFSFFTGQWSARVATDASLGRLSIDAVWGRTAGLKYGARKPHTIL